MNMYGMCILLKKNVWEPGISMQDLGECLCSFVHIYIYYQCSKYNPYFNKGVHSIFCVTL